jgi:hypothetical protein
MFYEILFELCRKKECMNNGTLNILDKYGNIEIDNNKLIIFLIVLGTIITS